MNLMHHTAILWRGPGSVQIGGDRARHVRLDDLHAGDQLWLASQAHPVHAPRLPRGFPRPPSRPDTGRPRGSSRPTPASLRRGPRRGTRHRPRAALAGRHPRAAAPRRRSHSGRRRLGPRIRRRIHGHTALTRGATRTRLTDSSAPSARPARAGRRPRVCGSGARPRHSLRTNGGRHTPPVDHARRALLRDRAVRAPRLHAVLPLHRTRARRTGPLPPHAPARTRSVAAGTTPPARTLRRCPADCAPPARLRFRSTHPTPVRRDRHDRRGRKHHRRTRDRGPRMRVRHSRRGMLAQAPSSTMTSSPRTSASTGAAKR